MFKNVDFIHNKLFFFLDNANTMIFGPIILLLLLLVFSFIKNNKIKNYIKNITPNIFFIIFGYYLYIMVSRWICLKDTQPISVSDFKIIKDIPYFIMNDSDLLILIIVSFMFSISIVNNLFDQDSEDFWIFLRIVAALQITVSLIFLSNYDIISSFFSEVSFIPLYFYIKNFGPRKHKKFYLVCLKIFIVIFTIIAIFLIIYYILLTAYALKQ